MSKKKNKVEKIETQNTEIEVKEEVIEEVKEEPKDEKQLIMEDFINFYNSTCKGKSHVSSEVGKQIVNYFNAYSDSKVVYNSCSSCIITKINYMRKVAKSKYNLEF